MFERIIRFAIEQRIVVMIAVLIMAGIGIYSYQKLPIDAVPDITNVRADQHCSAWLLALGNRTTDHVSS